MRSVLTHCSIPLPARMAAVSDLEQALDAYERRAWQEAYDALSACESLTAAQIDLLAESAHWLGRPDEAIGAYQRAYGLHLDAGAGGRPRSRRSCSRSTCGCRARLRRPTAGWPRAQRLLAGEDEGAEHGYPLYLQIAALMGSDLDAAARARAAHAGPRPPLRRRHAGRARRVLRRTGPDQAGARAGGLWRCSTRRCSRRSPTT